VTLQSLRPHSNSESARPWRLLEALACASLPNSSESIPAQCSGSAVLSPRQESSPHPRHCGTATVLIPGSASCTRDPEAAQKWPVGVMMASHLRRKGCAARRVCTENAARSVQISYRAAREAHREHRALARLAGYRHVAAHHARELAREGKAEPGAIRHSRRLEHCSHNTSAPVIFRQGLPPPCEPVHFCTRLNVR
jgi:hypothetical protein